MATNHTENYNLNLWEPTDSFVREEFNENTNKIDAALKDLSAGLTKVGRAEIVQDHTIPGSSFGIMIEPPNIDWNNYEYVCVLVKYADSVSGIVPTFTLMGNNFSGEYTEVTLPPLALPGYLIVLLPWHYTGRKTAGFVITDRLIPFTTDIPFRSLQYFQYSNQKQVVTPYPKITAFGGK